LKKGNEIINEVFLIAVNVSQSNIYNFIKLYFEVPSNRQAPYQKKHSVRTRTDRQGIKERKDLWMKTKYNSAIMLLGKMKE